MSDIPLFTNPRGSLFIPVLGGFYDRFAQPLAWTGFRALVGLALVYEGWPKILAPFAQVHFVENIGFYPGWLWSPVLAAMQVFGGLAIAVGFLTRPLALANAVMLLITLWFHFHFPYGQSFLTEAGIQSLASDAGHLFTPAGLIRLKDGGEAFLDQAQEKAEMLSLLWAGAVAFFAAFGGGIWSVDRFIARQF